MDVTIGGHFVLRAPLSHIGEQISTHTYLVQQPVIQPDGSVEEVAVYSGNAWRGQLRDLMGEYLFRRLGVGVTVADDAGREPRVTVDLAQFHLIYSGGSIGGEQTVNLEQARQYRRLLPNLALLGGGVGNQILPGKLQVNLCWPVCQEAPPARVTGYEAMRETVSYRSLTTEMSYSRKDDSKDDRLNWALPATSSGQPALDGAGEPAKPTKRDGPAEQMRMTTELLATGTVLETTMTIKDCTEVELGCLVSGLALFARAPHIGGQASRGHGLVDLRYRITVSGWQPVGSLDAWIVTRDAEPFVEIGAGEVVMSPRAEDAMAAYDAHLLSLYTSYLADNRGEIARVLALKAA